MRKLSKKISMLMVLAMLVGLFSGVVSASAASAWSFASSKYDVAVNGSINMESKEYADFDLLKDGKAPAGYTVAWASSDEDVVWVNAKTGQLRANKFGKAADGDKAVISATFTNTATKKSATRSFTIVLGAAKADFTVEADDVTIALGEEVKFAPVVKNADGKVVKFATHKSYNGYFLDGKAIANPWTPEEAGEYTVTVAQFAKKADVADLAKAVRKTEVKVTVAVADFDAKATGLKEITVYGDFAKDAKFAIKKNGTQNVAFVATVAEDGETAKLALESKLREGVYTVSYGDAKVDLAIEDEKVVAIVVLDDGKTVTTGNEGKEAYAHYDVFNQYGESVRKNFDITWTASTGMSVDDSDKTNGKLVIPAASGSAFVYGNPIVLTGVHTSAGNVATVNANLTVGLENCVSAVEVVGLTKLGSDKIIDALPAGFADGDYAIVFKMKDRLGYTMDYVNDTMITDSLTFTSFSPLLIKAFDLSTDLVVGGEIIGGVKYGAIKLNNGVQTKNGGVADIKVTSKYTGVSSEYALKVGSSQILADFKILPPEGIVAKNDGTIDLKYEAYDTEGVAVTDFRVLNGSLSFSSNLLKLEERNDGSAVLKYTVDTSVNPSKNIDIPVVYTTIIPETGKASSVTLNIKADRYAAGVKGYEYPSWGGENNILEGGSKFIQLVRVDDWATALSYYDQYDEGIWIKSNKVPANYKVAIKIFGAGLEVYAAGATAAGTSGDYKLFQLTGNNGVSFVASADVTDTQVNRVVEFALADENDKILSGSSFTVVYNIVDMNQCTGFSVSGNDPLIWNDHNDDTELSVKGTLANGTTVDIPDTITSTTGATITLVSYSSSAWAIPVAGTGNATVVAGGTAKKPTIALADGWNTPGNKQFLNLSVTNADGSNPERTLSMESVATIYGFDGVVKDTVKAYTTVAAGNERIAKSFKFGGWVAWGYDPWIEKGNTAYVHAKAGKIDRDELMNYIDKVVDQFGDEGALSKNDVTISINKLVEGSNGIKTNSLKKIDATTITGAEIGDTFSVTYSHGWSLSHTVNFTVGADKTAKYWTTSEPSEWR